MSDKGSPESLTGKPAAAAVLARGGGAAEAARAAGVSSSTLTRWRKEPGFCGEVELLTAASRLDVTAALSQASEALASEALASVHVLAELRDSADSPQVRRGAARDILTLCLELREHVAIEVRLTEVESRIHTAQVAADRGWCP